MLEVKKQKVVVGELSEAATKQFGESHTKILDLLDEGDKKIANYRANFNNQFNFLVNRLHNKKKGGAGANESAPSPLISNNKLRG